MHTGIEPASLFAGTACRYGRYPLPR